MKTVPILNMPDEMDSPIQRKKIGVLRSCYERWIVQTYNDCFSGGISTIISNADLNSWAVWYDIIDWEIVLRYAQWWYDQETQNIYGEDIYPTDNPEDIIMEKYKYFLHMVRYQHKKPIYSLDQFVNYFEEDCYGLYSNWYYVKMLLETNRISSQEFIQCIQDLLYACLDNILNYIREQVVHEQYLREFHMRILEWGLVRNVITMDNIPVLDAYSWLESRYNNDAISASVENDILRKIWVSHLSTAYAS